MNWLSKLFGKKKTPNESDSIELDVCPNCWGVQNYDGKFHQFVEDKTKSNINKEATGRKAFIQQFVEDHVDGIRLKNDHGIRSCPKCGTDYKALDREDHDVQ